MYTRARSVQNQPTEAKSIVAAGRAVRANIMDER